MDLKEAKTIVLDMQKEHFAQNIARTEQNLSLLKYTPIEEASIILLRRCNSHEVYQSQKENVLTPKEAKKIILNYGLDHQQRKFAEEVFELQQAIDRYGTIGTVVGEAREIQHITEELGDVQHLLKQFMGYFNITQEEVNEQEMFKYDRQIGRITEENKC